MNKSTEKIQDSKASSGVQRPSCFILLPIIASRSISFSVNDRLAEAAALAEALNLNVKGSYSVKVKEINPPVLIGTGQLEDLVQRVHASESTIVFIDADLKGSQQRNIEKALGQDIKVLDRTGVILDIFSDRAQSSEGRLQVQLALLNYQRTRLVRMWTHLERQRGSLGFIGGPGESQLEIDKRLIEELIHKLQEKLDKVKETRAQQKKNQVRNKVPVVALVGYTNAGKSTLFNCLTHENVLVKDMLFATLDTVRRKLKTPAGREIILADTVGFISDLPHQLVSAFRATLEETADADIILHVQDAASPNFEAQSKEVLSILRSLSEDVEKRIIPILNKIDLLKDACNPKGICISAANNTGIESLLKAVDDKLSESHKVYRVELNVSDGKALDWLHKNGEIHAQEFEGTKSVVEVSLSGDSYAKFLQFFK